MSRIGIRRAGHADLPTIVHLRREWTREESGDIADPDFEANLTAWFARELARRVIWLAEEGGRPVGMMNLAIYERMPRPGRALSRWGYLGNVFVLAAYRNRGIGGRLVSAALDYADENGFARVVLSPTERSIPLYERAGFGPAGALMVRTPPPAFRSLRNKTLVNVITGVGEPGPRPAALTLRRERVPPLELFGPACQDVLEPPERTSAGNGDLKPLGPARVSYRPDEPLHVPVAIPGALAVHPEPLIRIVRLVLVLLADLHRIVDGRLRPYLTGRQVDAPAAVRRVAFQDAGQLVEVHRQRAKIRYRAASQQRVELISQNDVTLPVPFPELGHHAARRLGSTISALLERGQHPVSEHLQAVLQGDRTRQLHDGRVVP